MRKKIVCILLLVILSLTVFTGCKANAIDVGGRVEGCKPSSSVTVRVRMKKNVYSIDEDIDIQVGYGFRFSDIRSYVENETPLELIIKADNFTISDGENSFEDCFEKSTTEYIDSGFVATLKGKRYMPNHFETYTLRFRSGEDQVQRKLFFNAGLRIQENIWEGDSVMLFFAINDKSVAFSEKSAEDAKKELK